jgi:hypothetical protein
MSHTTIQTHLFYSSAIDTKRKIHFSCSGFFGGITYYNSLYIMATYEGAPIL